MIHKMNVNIGNSNWLSHSTTGTSMYQQRIMTAGMLNNKSLCNTSILASNLYLGDILYTNVHHIHIYKNILYTLDFSTKDIK